MQLVIIRGIILLFKDWFLWSISIWVALRLVSLIWSCFSISWLIYSRKLLLWFGTSSFINLLSNLLLVLRKCWFLRILNCYFWSTTLNLVIVKAYSFIRDIVALLFFFFFWVIQMFINKSLRKFILCYCWGQELIDSLC